MENEIGSFYDHIDRLLGARENIQYDGERYTYHIDRYPQSDRITIKAVPKKDTEGGETRIAYLDRDLDTTLMRRPDLYQFMTDELKNFKPADATDKPPDTATIAGNVVEVRKAVEEGLEIEKPKQ